MNIQIAVKTKGVVSRQEVNATRVLAKEFPSLELYAHRSLLDAQCWTVSEATTGKFVVQGYFAKRVDAVKRARQVIESYGVDKVKERIAA